MKIIYVVLFFIFWFNPISAQDECGKISNINDIFLLSYSVAEMNLSTNYYYLDTCCIALELLQNNILPKLSNKNKMLVIESSFYIDKIFENEQLNLIINISNCQKRVFINGKFIAYLFDSNIINNYLIKINLPNKLLNFENISNELTIQIYPNQNFDYKLINNYIMSNKISDNYIFRQNYFPSFFKF